VDARFDDPSASVDGQLSSAPFGGLLLQREVRWAALSVAFFLAALAFRVGGEGWPSAVPFAGCYACGGWGPALSGLRALRRRSLDVDLLMVVAALVAMSIGQVVDGALLIVIFSTSSTLEAISARRTRDAVRSLLRLTPERASLLRSDGTEVVVEAEDLEPGDVIVVRPGERIGADGRVLAGASDVDEASITGEPLPAPKLTGAEVFAGTLNGSGVLQVEVTRSASESVVARTVAMVEQASETKAVTQLFVDRVERRYSVAMVAVTVALFVVPLADGAALQPTLLRAMTFMIVASPCAVVLATMPALLAAIANAGRHGVLVKSAVVMEQLGQISQIAFDKTGTLTRGTPRLESVRALVSSAGAETVLSWAAAAENPSEHPLGRAIVAAATDQGVSIGAVSAFYAEPGRGVRATVDGRQIAVSRPDALDDVDPLQTAGARAVVEEMEALGHTAMVVAADGIPVGVLAVTDQVRPDAAAAVSRLEELTGAPVVLLTGDNNRAAKAVADSVGIVTVRAQLLPHEKVETVRELESGGRKVAVVGDGVNDAPALAAAHLGVAMGRRGSDLTLETADVVVVRDELIGLPAAVRLSRHAGRVVKINLVFAGVVILALAGLDLTGHLPLPLGVAGHEGSTVVVGLNGLRLLRGVHWRP
jgi:heavy metal translocating P-type ATPase